MTCDEIDIKKSFDEFVLQIHIFSESPMRVRIRNDVSSYQYKTVLVTSKFIFITALTEDEKIFQELYQKVRKKIHKKKYLNFHAKIMILGWSKRPKHEPTTIFCDHGFGCTILKSSGTKTTKTIVLKKENHQYYHQNIQWRYFIACPSIAFFFSK